MSREEIADPGVLATDDVLVRGLVRDDLPHLVAIDRAAMGRPREEYYQAKVAAALEGGKLQTSLVAEVDGRVAGFVLCRLYYGEFGRAEPVAVLDSIGVHPSLKGRHVGQAMMRQLRMNLSALRVERIETQVDWAHFELLRFLAADGFKPAPRLCLELVLS